MSRLCFALLSLLMATAWPPNAHAGCPEESWSTEVATLVASVGNDEGIGGSGLISGDDEGIGGSGLMPGDDEGIGGSGLVGTITGFASICINGQRIAYEADVPVTILGSDRGSSALAVGQVVSVEVESGSGVSFARGVAIRYEVVGPAEVSGDNLSVLGQPIELGAGTTTPSSLAGKRIAVSGLRRPDGTIFASRVDLAEPSLPDAVRGMLTSDEDGVIRIAGVRVNARIIERDHLSGNAIAIGRWDSGSRTLMQARIVADLVFAPSVERVSLEGYVYTTPNGQLGVGGWKIPAEVVLETASRAPGAERPLLGAGVRVRVEAVRDAGKDFVVQRVWIIRENELMKALDRGAAVPAPTTRLRTPGAKRHRGSPFAKPRSESGVSLTDISDRPEPLERPEIPERFEPPEKPELPERPEL